MKYGFFLLKLSPKHWQAQQSEKRAQASKSNTVLPKIMGKFSLSSSKTESSADLDRSLSEEHGTRRSQA
ncbi:Coiled-coil domain-containing protein 38 [Lemmus lemmus]